MQQTRIYKLNLVEASDKFSPDPLNENMETVEAALEAARADTAAEAAARADADAAEASTRAAADAAETNARKSADTDEANTRAAAVAALDARLKKLETHKLVGGSYRGNGANTRIITLGFTPVAVYLTATQIATGASSLAVTGANTSMVAIVENGFRADIVGNTEGHTYAYLAFL